MTSTAFFYAVIVSGGLAFAALGIFALIVTGIRKGDRRHLASSPRSRADALAHRMLTRVRTSDREARQ